MHLLRLPYVQQYRISEYKDMMSPQDLESLKRMIKDAEISSSRFLTDGSFEDLRQYLMLMIERYHKHRLWRSTMYPNICPRRKWQAI